MFPKIAGPPVERRRRVIILAALANRPPGVPALSSVHTNSDHADRRAISPLPSMLAFCARSEHDHLDSWPTTKAYFVHGNQITVAIYLSPFLDIHWPTAPNTHPRCTATLVPHPPPTSTSYWPPSYRSPRRHGAHAAVETRPPEIHGRVHLGDCRRT